MQQKKISVFDIVGGKAAVSTEDGDGLFETMSAFLDKDFVVVLDFKNIETLTSTFLNAAIGQLYSKFEGPFLRERLKVENLQREDRELMLRVIERAKEYFKDKEKMEATIREALDEE